MTPCGCTELYVPRSCARPTGFVTLSYIRWYASCRSRTELITQPKAALLSMMAARKSPLFLPSNLGIAHAESCKPGGKC